MFKNIFVFFISCSVIIASSGAFARDVKVSTYSSSPEADYKKMHAENANLATTGSQVVIGAQTSPDPNVKLYVATNGNGNMAVRGGSGQAGIIRTVGGLRIEERTTDAPTTEDGRIWLIE